MSNNENNLDLSTTLWPLPAHFVIDSNPWVGIIKYQIHDHPPRLTAKRGEFDIISLPKIYIIIINHTYPHLASRGQKKNTCLVTLSPNDLLWTPISAHLAVRTVRTTRCSDRTTRTFGLRYIKSRRGKSESPYPGVVISYNTNPHKKCTKKGEKSLQKLLVA